MICPTTFRSVLVYVTIVIFFTSLSFAKTCYFKQDTLLFLQGVVPSQTNKNLSTNIFLLPSKSHVEQILSRSLTKSPVPPINSSLAPALREEKSELSQILEKMPQGDILFSYGNKDHLPFQLHWICNTMGWLGVHERTILVTSDTSSQDTIRKFSTRVHTYVVPESSRTNGFYSKGYRMLTIRRVEVLVEILASGRGVVMFEGDALWTSNILDDKNISDPNRIHDAALYRDGLNGELIGAGLYIPTQILLKTLLTKSLHLNFLYHRFTDFMCVGLMSMKGNRSGAYLLWKLILNRLKSDMKPFATKPDSTAILPLQAKHEQEILRQEILPSLLSDGTITVVNLDRCLYASGIWYDRKAHHVRLCGSKPPSVLNNNWIIGNGAKISRAKSAKHWFLDGSKCADWKTTLQRALDTFKN